uniref:Uncharacterized protein n=1 Tax=Tanacetum cinerariifolium TaxID=118510 RepID=A0A6L2KCM6_TANCI|nr:hypothetical protein [Tanacetum cinerariifolium]
MVWRGTSLRYETGEKKLNEVDFISQGVELVSRILATMTKKLSEIQIENEKEDELVAVVVKVEIENGLLEEVEVRLFGKKFGQGIGGENEDDNDKKLAMVNEERRMS